MKIKTIAYKLSGDNLQTFDDQVNAAMAEGWQLVKREVLPGMNLGAAYFAPHLCAELVQLDPAPGLPDPLEALRSIQAMCLATSTTDCLAGKCPLEEWCQQLAKGGDPTDWDIPGEEAAP